MTWLQNEQNLYNRQGTGDCFLGQYLKPISKKKRPQLGYIMRLCKLNTEIKENRLHLKNKKVLFHQDNYEV